MNEPLPILALIFAFVVVLNIIWGVRKVARGAQIERSRREIAAYVAEGSMTPEQGEKLLTAGSKRARED